VILSHIDGWDIEYFILKIKKNSPPEEIKDLLIKHFELLEYFI
jgi:hypothetical protein